jgi:CRISPR/Cas system-associated exonuclease Cas4 (RecB family)
MIIEKIDAYMERQIENSPYHANRASAVGHPCARHLVYCRTSWEQKALHDLALQYIFRGGHDEERNFKRLMLDAGIDFIEEQRKYSWKEYNVTGHIDWKTFVEELKKYIPTEFKGLAPYSYKALNSPDDFKKSKQFYIRGYLTQLTLYMLMDNKELGLFVLVDKVTKKPKEIEYELDYDFGESILEKLELINSHANAGTLPDKIVDAGVCGKCPFNHICLPDIMGEEVKLVVDEELISTITRWHSLKEYQKEYKQIDARLKETFREIPKTLAGDYIITGKWQKRGDNPQAAWLMDIEKIESPKSEDEDE